ncbi:MAG TPA: hypothetical protein VIA98_11315 [Allosphingosinicella sp.]
MDEGVLHVRALFSASSPALAAFDYLMAHAQAAGFRLVPRLAGAVKSVELQLTAQRRNHFSAQASPNHINFYLRGPVLSEHEGLFASAVDRFGAIPRNSLGEYRTHLVSPASVDAMLDFLRGHGAWPSDRHARRFVAGTFTPVSGEHLLNAARRLAAGLSPRPFGPSTDYDVLFDGIRLPPKAVFGLAAQEALAFPVRPENFSAGEGTVCFRILRSAGYPIVAKDAPGDGGMLPIDADERAWAEGQPRLVTHLRRERGLGLAAAKRDRFRAEHGRLYCERCGLDPVERYGSQVGEACIEVHHSKVHLADMVDGHVTNLDDLECLCASCHRVTHRELKLQTVAEDALGAPQRATAS